MWGPWGAEGVNAIQHPGVPLSSLPGNGEGQTESVGCKETSGGGDMCPNLVMSVVVVLCAPM